MTKTPKRIPQRMCIACREMKDKSDLIRIVIGDIQKVDPTGKSGGRGVYLCKNSACLNKAIKSKNISKQCGLVFTEQFIKEVEAFIEFKS
ncbi:MAG: YlxR family protein [Corallococcus sp.]|nr:YlxR family protein [Corallococcus sp.]